MRLVYILIAVVLIPTALVILHTVYGKDIFTDVKPTFILKEKIEVGNVPISIEVADTREARTRGLSERTSLPENGGLLFVFEEAGRHGIWMKNMQFPIDIIWISGDLTVVDIKQNATPASYPEVFRPRRDAIYVLEVNANFSEVHGLSVGDKVRLPRRLAEDADQ